MVALESFRKFKTKDFLAIILFAGAASLLSFFSSSFLNAQYNYIISLFLIIGLMHFTMSLINKAGTALSFMLFVSILTYRLNDLGAAGLNKLIFLVCAGLVFESVFLLLKLEVRQIQVDQIISAGIASASVPIIGLFLLSPYLFYDKLIMVANLSLLSLLIGIASAVISFFIYYHIKTLKMVLRFQFQQ